MAHSSADPTLSPSNYHYHIIHRNPAGVCDSIIFAFTFMYIQLLIKTWITKKNYIPLFSFPREDGGYKLLTWCNIIAVTLWSPTFTKVTFSEWLNSYWLHTSSKTYNKLVVNSYIRDHSLTSYVVKLLTLTWKRTYWNSHWS